MLKHFFSLSVDEIWSEKEILCHLCADEEVRNDVVAFRQVIAKLGYVAEVTLVVLQFFIVLIVVHKEVQVPLDDVSGVRKLLIHRFFADGMT